MESTIDRWLGFTVEVEEKLKIISGDLFSDTYKIEISNLLSQIRNEASNIPSLSLIEKQECYFRINDLGQRLRSTAYFT